ncbi:protein of unknown function [Candidatus Hydrogenisulfobacillus filiaventi]|uniref:Uncharacterized protein n=1 Tax=Candidatus Hydrogenisulfobacillus filiaventi TaxID=2707344 RepID=A0A6F8ZIV5_9FIRM|nr:protein of unknown function [Candidatus Hydrogenisulfobacillus filiaventi]
MVVAWARARRRGEKLPPASHSFRLQGLWALAEADLRGRRRQEAGWLYGLQLVVAAGGTAALAFGPRFLTGAWVTLAWCAGVCGTAGGSIHRRLLAVQLPGLVFNLAFPGPAAPGGGAEQAFAGRIGRRHRPPGRRRPGAEPGAGG